MENLKFSKSVQNGLGPSEMGRAAHGPDRVAGFGVSSSSVPDPFMKVPSHFGHFLENFNFFTPGFDPVTCGLVIQCYHHSTELPMGALPADPVDKLLRSQNGLTRESIRVRQVRRPVLYH